jgi:hypothetical protein
MERTMTLQEKKAKATDMNIALGNKQESLKADTQAYRAIMQEIIAESKLAVSK